jgi:hypothetical protein
LSPNNQLSITAQGGDFDRAEVYFLAETRKRKSTTIEGRVLIRLVAVGHK